MGGNGRSCAGRSRLQVACALLAITLAGAFVRADNLGLRSFSADEVLHVFAARALLRGEEPQLPSGLPYRRALPVTRAVAAAFAAWGESEAAARVPSVVAGVAAIPAIYLVGSSMFGPATGLLAAFLLAFSPDAVSMSRFVRMYAPLQGLLLLGAWAIYLGLAGAGRRGALGPGRRAVASAAGAALLFAAASLHPEAFLLAAAIGAYLVAASAGTALTAGWRAVARTAHGAAAGAALGCGVLVALVAPEALASLWERGTTRLPWFPAEARDARFYHYYLATTYGYLWFFAPAASIAVLLTAFRPGLYVALLFWVSFVALSALVETQSARYVFVILPFLFLLLAEAGRLAGALLWERLLGRLREVLPWPRLARPVAALLFVGALALGVRGSPWFAAAQSDRLKPVGEFAGVLYEQWREAAAYVGSSGVSDAPIVANSDHLAVYYFGRIDGRLLYTYQTPHAGDRDPERTAGGWRFVSYRSGAPSFSDLADLEAFVARHPRGWLILERRWLQAHPDRLAPGVRTFITRHLEEKKTPADASLAVFAWDGSRQARVRRGVGR
jgi:4-amino-4-deoxy-L-arabinose transferase-like glycosyltransferase